MFHICARVIAELEDNSSAKGVVVLLARKEREQIRQTADDFVAKQCDGVSLTDAQRRLLDRMRAALRMSTRDPE